MSAGEHSIDLILRTKLYRPRLTTDTICRDRLIRLMGSVEEMPLTLVSAPAGYGKSVLVSQWAEQHTHPTAWLSLDPGDGELRTFLEYLLASVDAIFPGACATTRSLLDSPMLPAPAAAADHLIHDFDSVDLSSAIVLDDYHRLDHASPVHDLMTRFLEHRPRRIHLVVVTRQDPPLPLARLRAGNQVREVRLQDLRFTAPETTAFLTAAEELDVSEEALANLEHEVEGWAVGLRLVTLALRYVPDPDAFLRDLHGGLPYTQEYLLQEVLGGLSPRIREYLLASSILDRFCVEVLAAICGPGGADEEPELDVGTFMEELQRSNLFAIPLDAQGKWCRYHHLFQGLLEHELRRVRGPGHIADLHARASEWFEAAGLIEEALKHALAAEDVQRAVRIVEHHRHPALNADRWYVLEQWLQLLPDATVDERADLLMARAWVMVHHSRFDVVISILDRIESLLEGDSGRVPLRGEVALLRGYILFFLGEGAASLEYIEEALERIPVSYYEARAQAEVIFALSSQMEGQREQALRGLDDLLAHYGSPSDLRKTRLLVTYVFIDIISGDLAGAGRSNRRLVDVAQHSRYAYAEAWAEYLQGLIHLHRFEWDAAIEFLERTVSRRFIHFKRAAVDAIAALMVARQLVGRQGEASATLELLRDFAASLGDPAYPALAESAEARLAILQARPEDALRWLERGVPPGGEAMLWWFEAPAVTRCRALISVGTPAGLEEAERQLRDRVATSEAHHNTNQKAAILPLLALACDRRGRVEEALAWLQQALSLAEPGGYILPFMELGTPMAEMLRRMDGECEDFARRVLAAFDERDAAAALVTPLDAPETQIGARGGVPTTADVALVAEQLTNRELDVLELLAQRLSNKEIAARLFVSPHTVGDHLKRLYRRLGVHTRRQAVQRAVELGVLDRR